MSENIIPKGLEWVQYFNLRTGEFQKPPLIVNKKDGSILVWIPAGDFEMGDGKAGNNPKHRVFLSGFYLGVYCVTNRQYKQFVDATGHRPPGKSENYSSDEGIWQGKSYHEAYADHPVVSVSWEDASAYCKWAGLALPTEAQWEKGARGPKGLLYPWGNDSDDKGRRHKKIEVFRETTCPVFDYPAGISGYGTYNQTGNVYEWCQDWYGHDYYSTSPPTDPPGPSSRWRRVFRGGFDATGRRDEKPSHSRAGTGFRPCLSAVHPKGKKLWPFRRSNK